MSDPQLTELAKTIGFNFVNDDLGFDVYEYTIVRKDEAVSKIVRILETPTDLERYEIISLLKSVLPFDLRWKLTKIVESVKLSSLAKMVEVLTFAVEEYKSQTDYAKLKRYGEVLGVDIEALGYKFAYKLPKKTKQEILAIIERNVPAEVAPILGKIKKIDYKIAFVKDRNNLEVKED